VYLPNAVKVLVTHLEKGTVTQISGVVHQQVDRAELLHTGTHQRLGAGARRDARAIGQRATTAGDDFRHHLLRTLEVDIVDHHRGTVCRQQQRVRATDAATRAAYGRRPALQQ
jgi:hypothetical protein